MHTFSLPAATTERTPESYAFSTARLKAKENAPPVQLVLGCIAIPKQELTQAHINRRLTSPSFRSDIIGSPIKPVQDIRCPSRLARKHLYGQQVRLLSHPKSCTPNSPRNMRAMTDGVNMVRVTDSIVGKTGTATEFLVVDVYARVHDIAVGTFAGAIVVDVGSAWLAAVGDGT